MEFHSSVPQEWTDRGCKQSCKRNNSLGGQQLRICLLVPDSGTRTWPFILSALCNSVVGVWKKLWWHVVSAVRGSQSISIQVLVIHGDMLGRRIYDSICWSSCKKRRGRMEAWMESETTNSCVFGKSSELKLKVLPNQEKIRLEIRLRLITLKSEHFISDF